MSFGSYSVGSVAYGGELGAAVAAPPAFIFKKSLPVILEELGNAPATTPRYVYSAPLAALVPPRRTLAEEVVDTAIPAKELNALWVLSTRTPARRPQPIEEEPVGTTPPAPHSSFLWFFNAPLPTRRPPPMVEEMATPTQALPRVVSWFLNIYTPKRQAQRAEEEAETAVARRVTFVPKVATVVLIPNRRPITQEEAITPTPAKRASALAWLFKAFRRAMLGRARVANDASTGYVVYVGYGQMPDFNAPAGFGATLPVATAITPPLTGTVTLWVVTRRRNAYGLESQNSQPEYITVDTAGNEVFGPLTTPVINSVTEIENDSFSLLVTYPGLTTDPTPADTWRIYAGTGAPPVPGIDTPAATGSISVDTAVANIGPYPTGGVVYYFAVTVYRTVDGLESAAGTTTLTLPPDPDAPQEVLGDNVEGT